MLFGLREPCARAGIGKVGRIEEFSEPLLQIGGHLPPIQRVRRLGDACLCRRQASRESVACSVRRSGFDRCGRDVIIVLEVRGIAGRSFLRRGRGLIFFLD